MLRDGVTWLYYYWVLHELEPRDVERRFCMSEMLLERHKKKSFLHRIVTANVEIWRYFGALHTHICRGYGFESRSWFNAILAPPEQLLQEKISNSSWSRGYVGAHVSHDKPYLTTPRSPNADSAHYYADVTQGTWLFVLSASFKILKISFISCLL